MKENFLISTYQEAQFKVFHKNSKVNREEVKNVVDWQFSNHGLREILISDLTYIRIGHRVACICLISDLFNREIVGCSVGFSKTPELVLEALNNISFPLEEVVVFHADRGSEFKNDKIDRLLLTFEICRSLSDAGVPYDNACAESLYNKVKHFHRWFTILMMREQPI